MPKLGGTGISLYGVFDGHNGSLASQFCSAHIPYLLAHSEFDLHSHTQQALEDAFKQADSDFLSQDHQNTMNAGTTALVMLADENKLTVASVGDSRAILLKKDGSVLPLSTEHKPDRLDERDRIARAGGTIEHWGVWRVEGLLAMSRAIGDEQLKKFIIPDPDVTTTTITPGEDMFVILGSDGLFDVLRNDEIASMCRGMTDCEVVGNRLAHEVVHRGIVDNTTVSLSLFFILAGLTLLFCLCLRDNPKQNNNR